MIMINSGREWDWMDKKTKMSKEDIVYSIGDAGNDKLLAEVFEEDYITLLDECKVISIDELNGGYSYYYATDKIYEEEIKSKQR